MHDERREFTRRSDRIEELVMRVEAMGDPAIRATAQELLQAVIELHGVALDHMLHFVAQLPQGEDALISIAGDDLVSKVLSLHGLNPISIAVRVEQALDVTRPYLQSHGGDVELESVDGNEVHIRLQGSCGSCSSSSETLKSTVEEAIYQAAPEVVTVIAEAIDQSASSKLVQLQTN
jgi:Fe-S cluster biogenesis protein NfuA